jgi:hypothetical protein
MGNVSQNILLTVGTLHLLFVSKKRQDEKEKIDTTIYRFTCFIHKMYADMD